MNELRIKLLMMVIIDKFLQETIKGTFRFLETKPNQFSKTEKRSDCTLKRSSSFEDKSYACRLAPSFCSSWFRGMGDKLI